MATLGLASIGAFIGTIAGCIIGDLLEAYLKS